MNGKINIEDLKNLMRGKISLNEPMTKHTTLKIGGPADLFVVPADKEDVIALVGYLTKNELPFFILGRGSNILVGDKGIREVVIAIKDTLDYVEYENDLIRVGAGYNWPRFVLDVINKGYGGIESTAGIPGTVGGAIIMNAGAYGTEVFEFITEVQLIRSGKFETLTPDQIEFGYRHTNLRGDLILEATLKLPHVSDSNSILTRRKELLTKRNLAQPLNKPNAGSIFKNPPGKFAGVLIEAAGLKGTRIGDALVSEKHANFLVNCGSATAHDMMQLIDKVRQCVKEHAGVDLELEVIKTGEGF